MTPISSIFIFFVFVFSFQVLIKVEMLGRTWGLKQGGGASLDKENASLCHKKCRKGERRETEKPGWPKRCAMNM